MYLAGCSTIEEFSRKVGVPGSSTRRYIKQGYCPWPRKAGIRDGRTRHPLYKTWDSMIGRCYHITNASYGRYGAKGIIVCDRWREDFANFIEDMGDKPSKTHTLDRIDSTGNYEPSNCRWATRREQQLNRDVKRGNLQYYSKTVLLRYRNEYYGSFSIEVGEQLLEDFLEMNKEGHW